MSKKCYSSWDCSASQQCRDNKCETRPECREDEINCGECLGPVPPPKPNENGPNCGKGDPSEEKYDYEQCVFTCTAFCDEWYKIVGNLTADTDIKDCTPDDACSACRVCDVGGNCEEMQGSARPCYCPPYVTAGGVTVDPAEGKECFTCNTDSGEWEEQPDFCMETCSKTVICDDGRTRTATVNAARGAETDVCTQAFNKALGYCRANEDESRKCDLYTKPCEVEGPLSGPDVTYETEGDFLKALQSGQTPMPEGGGDYLKLNMEVTTIAQPGNQIVKIIPSQTKINGGNIKFNVVDGYVTVGGGLPPKTISGKVQLSASLVNAGQIITSNVDEIDTTPDGEELIYLWYADNVRIPEGDSQEEGAGQISEDGTQYTIGAKDEGKYITLEVTIASDRINPDTGAAGYIEPTIKSNLIGPCKPELVNIDAQIYINGNTTCGETLTADYSELYPYQPDINPITIQWIDFETGLTFSAQNYLFLTENVAGKRFFVRAQFQNYLDETQFIDSQATSPISYREVIIGPCNNPPPVVSISGVAREGQTLQAKPSLPGTPTAGPFYQWMAGGQFLLGETFSNLTLAPADVGKRITVEVSYRDQNNCFGTGTSLPTAVVENDPAQGEGAIYILGEARVDKTLTTVNNIRDKDGVGRLKYQWYADGQPIESANGTKSTLKVTDVMIGKKIKVIAYWVDDFEQDKEIESRETAEVKPSKEDVVLSVRPSPGLSPEEKFSLYIDIEKGDQEITSIETAISWAPQGVTDSNGAQIPPEPGKIRLENVSEQAENGSLAIEWISEDAPDCPEGFGCFYSDRNSSGQRVEGATFFHKCPYPGWPDLTYDEYLENPECERTCVDACYQYTVVVPEGGPEPTDGRVVEVINTGASTTTYLMEYCVDSLPETDDKCTGDKQNYIGVFHQQFPDFVWYECTCEVPVGKGNVSKGGHEYSYTTAGLGPWILVPDEEAPEDPFYQCPWQDEFQYDCRMWRSRPRIGTLCGGDGKYAPIRSFFVKDAEEQYTQINSGLIWWDDLKYVQATIYQRSTSSVWNPSKSGADQGFTTIVTPYVPVEALPPNCPPGAPEQIAYINLTENKWYGFEYGHYVEAKNKEFAPVYLNDFTEFVQLEEGAELYDPTAYRKPWEDDENRDPAEIKLPTVEGPAEVSFSQGGSINIARYKMLLGDFERQTDLWRFVDNFSDRYLYFRITGGGQLQAAAAGIPGGTYNVQIQCYNDPIWSKAFDVAITVIE